ncbi:hypothetical protein GCM10011378_08440 [Hymenobacter glacieicola]|uniref:Uncharacterized protein n=2 Tax=Hymenobacter glacieicola TaxID=1562124 RepID=A0ABQ1WK31_9BACT|nr:hypothetical protein GCM10011378_08440 [Hymenobacter glacieicola]
MTLRNVKTSEPCPECGASVSTEYSGQYYFNKKGLATLLSGPEFTQEALSKLAELVKDASAQSIPYETFQRAAEAITPAASGFTEFLNNRNWEPAAKWLKDAITAILIGVAINVVTDKIKGDDKPTVTNITVNKFYNTPPPPAPTTTKRLTSLDRLKNMPTHKGKNHTPPKKKRR